MINEAHKLGVSINGLTQDMLSHANHMTDLASKLKKIVDRLPSDTYLSEVISSTCGIINLYIINEGWQEAKGGRKPMTIITSINLGIIINHKTYREWKELKALWYTNSFEKRC